MKLIYNNETVKLLNLSIHEITLLQSLEQYYNNNNNFFKLAKIINGEHLISRRTIEYFVTNYCKVTLSTKYIYYSYKDQLKAFKKIYFDPFGRGSRIPFILGDNYIITTIAQLNFYRWFFENSLDEYCIKNIVSIQQKLNKSEKKEKSNNKIDTILYKKTTSMIITF